AVELRVEVRVGLAQRAEAGDPHLGRRERVHPDHEADAGGRGVRLGEEAQHLLGRLHDRLDPAAAGDARRSGEGPRGGAGVVGDLLQRLGAVEMLAAGYEPDFRVLQGSEHDQPTFLCRVPVTTPAANGVTPTARRTSAIEDAPCPSCDFGNYAVDAVSVK